MEAKTITITMNADATPPAVMNGRPATPMPRMAMTTGATGEHDGLAGGGAFSPRGIDDGHTKSQVFAVPGNEEQGVVDADTEPDHAPAISGAKLGISIR